VDRKRLHLPPRPQTSYILRYVPLPCKPLTSFTWFLVHLYTHRLLPDSPTVYRLIHTTHSTHVDICQAQCFNTIGWVAGRASVLYNILLYSSIQRFSVRDLCRRPSPTWWNNLCKKCSSSRIAKTTYSDIRRQLARLDVAKQLNGSVKEPNISLYFFFLPITQWCPSSDVLFTGGRGVSDFSVLKYN